MTVAHARITRRRIFAVAASFTAIGLFTLPGSPALADSGAEQFVGKIANQAIAAARTGSVSSFQGLVRRHSAVSSVASFALGKYRRKLPASKKREYVSLVTRFIAKLFARNSKSFAGQSYVVKSSFDRSGSKDIIVKGVLLFSGGRAAALEWRILRSGGRYRVFDVRVKGVWLALQMRQEFVSVLRESGGDFNALLRYLKS